MTSRKSRQDASQEQSKMDSQVAIRDLERKKDMLQTKLVRFSSFLNALKNSPNPSRLIELDTRLKDIESHLLRDFNNVQFDLEGIDFDRFQEDPGDTFESKYYEVISDAKQFIFDISSHSVPSTQNPSDVVNSTSSSSCTKPLNVKLPLIELPKFSGDFNQWLEFKELFLSLIHNVDNLDAVQKLHYLRTSLKDSALQCIQSLEVTESNYEISWKILCERFDNKRLMIHNYIRSLFNISDLKVCAPANLRSLVDTLSKILRALESMGVSTLHWDPMIIYLVTSKLDKTTLFSWEQHESASDLPTVDELKSFLVSRANLLEKVNLHEFQKSSHKANDKSNFNNFQKRDSHPQKCLLSNSHEKRDNKHFQRKFACYHCSQNHSIYKCPEFLSLTLPEKWERVKSLNLCENCLQKGHTISQCKSGPCRRCSENHNSLLHPIEPQVNPVGLTLVEQVNSSVTDQPEETTVCKISSASQVLLATVLVNVVDSEGQSHLCRALLDNASMSNFVSSKFASKLSLSKFETNTSVTGIDEANVKVSQGCTLQVCSFQTNFNVSIQCFILPKITNKLPLFSLSHDSINIPSNVSLSDPKFYLSQDIDMLIGAEVFWRIMCKGFRNLGPGLPVLQNTKFGWIVTGSFTSQMSDRNSQQVSTCHLVSQYEIQTQLQTFWELEEVATKCPWSQEEQMAEQHFIDTVRRSEDGRFVVSIPLKESISKLGHSRDGAAKQFFSLEKRLNYKPELKNLYCQFMTEYEQLQHMSPFQPSDGQTTFYSPHHGVFREDSSTTKLRVVFNSSFASSSGLSYNSIQMVGPTVQEDLVSILLRFRQHSFVINADICKMYRQILVADEFKPLQLILWRSNSDQELLSYSLNTVVYGTASAPFLATRCLLQLSLDHLQSHPLAAKSLKRDFYVDDFLSGSDSVSEAIDLANQVSSILESAGFQLRKWRSNCSTILSSLNNSKAVSDEFYFGSSDSTKTLGMSWSSSSDYISFFIHPIIPHAKVTKRVILSEVAKIFDPLGLLSPVVIRAKMFLQKLWSLNIPWDGEVPTELARKWKSFRLELPELNKLNIPRQATCKDCVRAEIHGFSDASQYAYGACIFLRTIDKNQNVFVNLLVSKTRVAPLKSISIPRLELCGALLLSKLFSKVTQSLTFKIDDSFMWCDSTVALAWIRSSPHQFQVFVGNRVTEIQGLTPPEMWNYVPTELNPADLVSRGTSPKQLVERQREWLTGPTWLYQSRSEWPVDITISEPIDLLQLPETKKNVEVFVQVTTQLFPFNRFSSFTRIRTVMALVLRFIHNCKCQHDKRKTNQLSVEEHRSAEDILIKLAQKESFGQDLNDLEKTGNVSKTSNLLSLSPFLKDNVVRVGGRLKHAPYSFDIKHPILLSGKHHLSLLIMREKHISSFHCAPELLLSRVREKYWIISGRNLAKKVVRTCIVCFKFNPKFVKPIMGNLPAARVSPQMSVFTHVGIDYAGPFFYKDHAGRAGKTRKCYLCLFICLTVKAVHLELTTELSTSSFLQAFQRFISRRGKPLNVYTDNGSNFLGANNQLNELGQFLKSNQNCIIKQLGTDLDINWKFIAAYSPHHGGIWEAGIKCAKRHLMKVLSNLPFKPTFEHFCTILSQIECILNSRPLTRLSSDPNDLCALTPSYFLIGRDSSSLPYPDLEHTPVNRLALYEKLEKIKQQFWHRWSVEYIRQLQQRQKWKINCRNLAVGELVLVHDNDLPPFRWKLGRVSEVHPGTDGVVRVATVKTAYGTIKRAVVKLAPLPIDTSM